ncbi:MAG: hypothetical protein RhofKO_27230 [Rhodothermales bacterium]
MLRLCFVFVGISCVVGCVPSRAIEQWEPPRTLSHVNAELGGKIGKIDLMDGTTIRFAETITVQADSVYWWDRYTEQMSAVRTDEVAQVLAMPQIQLFAPRRSQVGIAALAFAGLVAASVGRYWPFRCSGECSGAQYYSVALAGAIGLGSSLWWQQAKNRREVVVYHAPVEAYLSREAP